jgi:hypothetical protein
VAAIAAVAATSAAVADSAAATLEAVDSAVVVVTPVVEAADIAKRHVYRPQTSRAEEQSSALLLLP